MHSHRSVQTTSGEGLVVPEPNELASLVKQFGDSQRSLLYECQKQTRWNTLWVAVGALSLLLMSVAAVGAGYYLYSNKKLEREFEHRLGLAQKDGEAKLEEQLSRYEQRHREELTALHGQQQQGQQHLFDFVSRLEEHQQKAAKSYEEKILKLEKEKLSLQQANDELRKSWKETELKLLQAGYETDSLRGELAVLKKQAANAQKEVEYWKKLAGEKFSPEEWASLQYDLKQDK